MKNVRLYQNTILNVGDCVTLDVYASHHLSKVLRFPEGRSVILFNGDGMNYITQVLQVKKECVVKILDKTHNLSESKLNITLVQGIAKGDKMDFIMQKSVELGVNKIIPIFTERCVVKLKDDKLIKRQLHWQKIVIGACEQSGRCVVPKVYTPINLKDFLRQPVINGFVLHCHCEQTLSDVTAADEVNILIGPEGGFSEVEIKKSIQAGYQPLLLGSRVLRTETASLVAIANMQMLWGS